MKRRWQNNLANNFKRLFVRNSKGKYSFSVLYEDRNQALAVGLHRCTGVIMKDGKTYYFPLTIQKTDLYLGILPTNHGPRHTYAVLTDGNYVMMFLYPDTYHTMEYVPDPDKVSAAAKNCASLLAMFWNCYNLKRVPYIDTSDVTDMNNMFRNCHSLIHVPKYDTSNVTNMNCLFAGCHALTEIPSLNTSKATDMSYMFNSCRSLVNAPNIDTSNAETLQGIFSDCHNLVSVPNINTTKARSLKVMFINCKKLTAVPQMNTANVTDMEETFAGCHALTSVPVLDIRNVTNITNMFLYTKVTSVTFRNKPANLEINSQILCGDPNKITTINFV